MHEWVAFANRRQCSISFIYATTRLQQRLQALTLFDECRQVDLKDRTICRFLRCSKNSHTILLVNILVISSQWNFCWQTEQLMKLSLSPKSPAHYITCCFFSYSASRTSTRKYRLLASMIQSVTSLDTFTFKALSSTFTSQTACLQKDLLVCMILTKMKLCSLPSRTRQAPLLGWRHKQASQLSILKAIELRLPGNKKKRVMEADLELLKMKLCATWFTSMFAIFLQSSRLHCCVTSSISPLSPQVFSFTRTYGIVSSSKLSPRNSFRISATRLSLSQSLLYFACVLSYAFIHLPLDFVVKLRLYHARLIYYSTDLLTVRGKNGSQAVVFGAGQSGGKVEFEGVSFGEKAFQLKNKIKLVTQ